MTLGRRGREPVRRATDGDPRWSSVELEELPAQRVVPGARRRPPLAPLVSAAGVLALLAVGLGVFGGKQAPRSSGAALAPSVVPGAPSEVAAAPGVTANVPCRPSAAGAPIISLDVDGTSTPPVEDEIELHATGTSSFEPTRYVELATTQRLEIPSDSRPAVRIAGFACALSWSIDLVDPNHVVNLERVENPGDDPVVAQQNRFLLPLARYRGADYNLVAQFTFASALRRGTWPIRILPFDVPNAHLAIETGPTRRGIDVAPGCDVTLQLANGYRELLSPCFRSVRTEPRDALVGSDQVLEFGFDDGWVASGMTVDCGVLSEGSFASMDGDCAAEWWADGDHLSIAMPSTPDQVWTVAFSGCAELAGTDSVCGTWYATLDVTG